MGGFKDFLLESPQNDSNIVLAAGVLRKVVVNHINSIDNDKYKVFFKPKPENNPSTFPFSPRSIAQDVYQSCFDDNHYSILITNLFPFKNINEKLNYANIGVSLIPYGLQAKYPNERFGTTRIESGKVGGYHYSFEGRQYIAICISPKLLAFDNSYKPDDLAWEFNNKRSVFTHEFTHAYDNIRSNNKYLSKYKKSRIWIGTSSDTFDVKAYNNSDHEVNARYSQMINELISELVGYIRVKEGKFKEMFPNFRSFLDSATIHDVRVRFTLGDNVLDEEHKKKFLRRLIKFYDMMCDMKDKNLDDFVKNGRKSRLSAKYFNSLDGMK